jgi:hypothetical protein
MDLTELFTETGARALLAVDDFLLSTIIEYNIETEPQATNSRFLGNELQKFETNLKHQLELEVADFKEQIKRLQGMVEKREQPFRERIGKIIHYKKILQDGLTKWERENRERQRIQQEEAAQEVERQRVDLEKLAEIDPENADMYTSQAAMLVAPYIAPENRDSKRGVRQIDDPHVHCDNLKIFLQWCMVSGETHFVDLNEKKLIARAKERGGTFEAPGIRVEILKKTSFTGR